MRISYSEAGDALYIRMSDAGDVLVSRTVQMDSGTMVDLDRFGKLVGIEVLRPARTWPLDEILTQYDLDDDSASTLRAMWSVPNAYPFGIARQLAS